MKFGITRTAYELRPHSDDPNNPADYTVDQLIKLAHDSTLDGLTPIVMDVTKFNRSASGDLQTVTDAPVGKMTLCPVGSVFQDTEGADALFWCWTTEDVTQPGNDVVVTLTDAFGQPQMDGGREKRDVFVGGIKERSFVLIRFRDGVQSGEVVLTITKEWAVMFASMKSAAPFADPMSNAPSLWGFLQQILPPIPVAMAGTVTDSDISRIS